MAAYLVALVRINDEERFAKYLEGVGPTLEPYGCEVLVIDAAAEVLEGESSYPRVVVLKFPSKEHARNWKNSPEYVEVVKHRHAAADGLLYLCDEFVPPSA
jgi:uncharacterized protein (DUF1330 family)